MTTASRNQQAAFSGPERRRSKRRRVTQPSSIVTGRDSYVFCQTLDVSAGGVCLAPPNQYLVQVGERLLLAARWALDLRTAVVVSATERKLHCVFVPADPAEQAA